MAEEKETKLKIPLSLNIIESGVAGVRFEIFPLLLRDVKSQEELDAFGSNMMSVLGTRYVVPLCGSALWVIYKEYCKKDIKLFLQCADDKHKRMALQLWLLSNFRG